MYRSVNVYCCWCYCYSWVHCHLLVITDLKAYSPKHGERLPFELSDLHYTIYLSAQETLLPTTPKTRHLPETPRDCRRSCKNWVMEPSRSKVFTNSSMAAPRCNSVKILTISSVKDFEFESGRRLVLVECAVTCLVTFWSGVPWTGTGTRYWCAFRCVEIR